MTADPGTPRDGINFISTQNKDEANGSAPILNIIVLPAVPCFLSGQATSFFPEFPLLRSAMRPPKTNSTSKLREQNQLISMNMHPP